MSAMTRSAHGLSTPVDENWRAFAECAKAPDMWFSEPLRRVAMHVCLSHCPVLDQCREDAQRARPRDQVQGGIAWNRSGHPAYGGLLNAQMTCGRCR